MRTSTGDTFVLFPFNFSFFVSFFFSLITFFFFFRVNPGATEVRSDNYFIRFNLVHRYAETC